MTQPERYEAAKSDRVLQRTYLRMTFGVCVARRHRVSCSRAPQLVVRPADFVRPAQAINGSSNIGISSEE